jgi:hypothetical protein
MTDLVSAKLEGRSTVMAPPKRGVFVNDIFGEWRCGVGSEVEVDGSGIIDVACC